jgi:hypothetical protein
MLVLVWMESADGERESSLRMRPKHRAVPGAEGCAGPARLRTRSSPLGLSSSGSISPRTPAPVGVGLSACAESVSALKRSIVALLPCNAHGHLRQMILVRPGASTATGIPAVPARAAHTSSSTIIWSVLKESSSQSSAILSPPVFCTDSITYYKNANVSAWRCTVVKGGRVRNASRRPTCSLPVRKSISVRRKYDGGSYSL